MEKPLTLTIEEGPPIVKAARVNNRICQVGMQQRSGEHYLQAKREYIDTGKLGKITHGAHLVARQHLPSAQGARSRCRRSHRTSTGRASLAR